MPQPLARIRIEYGPPRRVPRDADRATLEEMATAIGAEMDALTEAAAERLRP